MKLGSTGPEIAWLQRRLADLGLYDADFDGIFGALSDRGVRAYQRMCDLTQDGEAGPVTIACLRAEEARYRAARLHDFRGLLGFTLGKESHAGKPYVPPDPSGGTTDPGVDWRHQTWETVCRIYAGTLTLAQLEALRPLIGAPHAIARQLIETPAISSVRISRDAAALVFPRVAESYWIEACRACPEILHPKAPAALHTAALSLCINRWSQDLAQMRPLIKSRAWSSLLGHWKRLNRGSSLAARRDAEAQIIQEAIR